MATLRYRQRTYLLCLKLISLIVCLRAEEYIPTLIWETSRTEGRDIFLPSLAKLSSTEFSAYLQKKLSSYQQPPLVLLFVSNILRVEDLSRRDTSGQGIFPRLKALMKDSARVSFLPSVAEPVRTVEAVIPKLGNGTGSKTLTALVGSKRFLVFNLDKPMSDEKRGSLLQRHDREISRAFTSYVANLTNDRPSGIVAIYTARNAIPPREKKTDLLQSDDPNPETPGLSPQVWVGFPPTCIVIYFFDKFPIFYDLYAKTSEELKAISVTSGVLDESHHVLHVDCAVGGVTSNLSFVFSFSGGYWQLDKVGASLSGGGKAKAEPVDLMPTSAIGAPISSSLRMKGDIVLKGGVFQLVMTDTQMQAFMASTAFSTAQDGAPFFTAGIWAGLASTFFVLAILACGISMITDIKVNDRFDDQKVRTISFGADG